MGEFMNVYKYFIELIDPIFYSQEGLSAATTPSYLHATAVNHAVAYGLGKGINQPYIISEENGGRNIPRYESSKYVLIFTLPGKNRGEYHISTTN